MPRTYLVRVLSPNTFWDEAEEFICATPTEVLREQTDLTADFNLTADEEVGKTGRAK